MKTWKKLLLAMILSLLVINNIYTSYQEGRHTAYAAFVVDDITIGVAALVILSSAATAEYFRQNPAQFENIVEGVKSTGGTAGQIFAQIGAQIATGVAVQLSLLQQGWEALRDFVTTQSPPSGSVPVPTTVSVPGQVILNFEAQHQVLAFIDNQGKLSSAFEYYISSTGKYSVFWLPGHGQGFLSSSVPLYPSVFWAKPFVGVQVGSEQTYLFKSQTDVHSISLHWFPSLEAYNEAKDKGYPKENEGENSISLPQTLPSDLPDTLTADRQAVQRWKDAANPAIPQAKDWFPAIDSPAVPGNPDIPKNPPANNPPWFPDISNILNKILNALKSLLEAIKAIPALLTSILTQIRTMFDVSKFKLDFSGLKITITDRFPFCIPFDLLNAVKVFAAQARTPEFRVNLNTAYIKIDDRIDLGLIAYPLGFFRMVAVWYYIVFLMRKTRDFIKW